MSTALNITRTRLAVLRLLSTMASATKPFHVGGLADRVAPRPLCAGRPSYWTSQGAARMGGNLVRPLEKAGLLKVGSDRSGHMVAWLTDAGRQIVEEADRKAVSAAQEPS